MTVDWSQPQHSEGWLPPPDWAWPYLARPVVIQNETESLGRRGLRLLSEDGHVVYETYWGRWRVYYRWRLLGRRYLLTNVPHSTSAPPRFTVADEPHPRPWPRKTWRAKDVPVHLLGEAATSPWLTGDGTLPDDLRPFEDWRRDRTMEALEAAVADGDDAEILRLVNSSSFTGLPRDRHDLTAAVDAARSRKHQADMRNARAEQTRDAAAREAVRQLVGRLADEGVPEDRIEAAFRAALKQRGDNDRG